MKKDLRQLLEQLGEAIHSSLSESDRFAEAMTEMEQAGYSAYVLLEASIGFRENDDCPGEPSEAALHLSVEDKPSSEITAFDRNFLRDLKISLA